MKDIKKIKGKYHIAELIEQGEHDEQDFKLTVNDAMKIARTLSAFANKGGGRLLIGVKDNGVIAGLRSEEDIFVVEQAAQMYCRPAIDVEFTAYRATDDGLVVLKAEVKEAVEKPVRAREHDGRWRAYYRVADENILASALMIKVWQRRESLAPLIMDINSSGVIDFLERCESATIAEIALGAHLSMKGAEDVVVMLAAMNMVTFVHTPRGFEIMLPD